MDILNSNWLIKMLEKSSPTPHGRLLSLFDILEDWLDAPNIKGITGNLHTQEKSRLLQDFLTLEAAKAGAAMPEMLANQLYFMALAAAQERLQEHNQASLSHAKNAAKALILAQTKQEFHITKPAVYAIAASFIAAFVMAGFMLMPNLNQATNTPQIAVLNPLETTIANVVEYSASPEQTAALMAQLEQMRHGNCQLIEAIQLPDNVKGVYINMIVNGQVSTNLREQQIAMELLKQTRCNYTPMLMANSTG